MAPTLNCAAAEQDYAAAQFKLGALLYLADAHAAGAAQACAWYLKAARQGYALAQFALGAHHDSGQGVPQDYPAACFWYLCAGRQGRAQCNVGLMYLDGQGTLADPLDAALWLQRAAQGGIAAASRFLQRAMVRLNPAQRAQFERLTQSARVA